MPAMRICDLTRYYGAVCGVRDLSFTVQEGRIFGFLGANGAGKTTTIRLLLGLIAPSRGEIELLGQKLETNRFSILQEIGYLPGELNLYPHVLGEDLLDLFSSFYSKGRVGRKRALEALKLTEKDLRRPFGEYSLGMKQKLGLVQALQHQPRLLIMDEPTTGLDPVMQRSFHALIREVNREGTTIFMSSHNLAEVESCCDEVAIVYKGKLVAKESLLCMKEERVTTIKVLFREDVPKEDLDIPGTDLVACTGRRAVLEVDGEICPALERLSLFSVSSLEVNPVSLEEIFLEYYDTGAGDSELL